MKIIILLIMIYGILCCGIGFLEGITSHSPNQTIIICHESGTTATMSAEVCEKVK